MQKKYETIFIINSDLGEESTKALVEKFKTMIETSAQLVNLDEWGKRKLAYEIHDKTEGYYVLVNFLSSPDFPAELERVYKITEGILKFITINKD
ncbi:MAG TPA: 30S ribosomal protein S6 [Ruminiclostridium sp.]